MGVVAPFILGIAFGLMFVLFIATESFSKTNRKLGLKTDSTLRNFIYAFCFACALSAFWFFMMWVVSVGDHR